jgi:hypothetical protein
MLNRKMQPASGQVRDSGEVEKPDESPATRDRVQEVAEPWAHVMTFDYNVDEVPRRTTFRYDVNEVPRRKRRKGAQRNG